ncbi:hypothetical protein C8R43DRAFT_190704 [Mycena crocata]|nr:hypothetical protein C8R43DRAFT_190704 [Mycena crocata]
MHPFLAAFIVTSAAAAAALPTGTVLAELSNALSAHDVLENTAESTVGSITSITGLESPHFATAGTIVPRPRSWSSTHCPPRRSLLPSSSLTHLCIAWTTGTQAFRRRSSQLFNFPGSSRHFILLPAQNRML